MTCKATAEIRNEAGIHCRPSAHIIKAIEGYEGRIRLVGPTGEESALDSMMSLMMLGLTHGSRLDIEVEGPDEEARAAQLVDLFETEYDFPQ